MVRDGTVLRVKRGICIDAAFCAAPMRSCSALHSTRTCCSPFSTLSRPCECRHALHSLLATVRRCRRGSATASEKRAAALACLATRPRTLPAGLSRERDDYGGVHVTWGVGGRACWRPGTIVNVSRSLSLIKWYFRNNSAAARRLKIIPQRATVAKQATKKRGRQGGGRL